ncbi:MAG: GNAT family N-acetyltransferase [Halioglobus sp.]
MLGLLEHDKAMKVLLKAMNEESFSDYIQIAIPVYAKSNVDSGRWEESQSLALSKSVHASLLPDGNLTKDNYLFNIVDGGSDVKLGHIWVKIEDHSGNLSGFIYDLEIYPAFRRRGYAKLALGILEELVAGLGATSLRLHVFNQNSAAIDLYNSLGYQTVSHNMQKQIALPGDPD